MKFDSEYIATILSLIFIASVFIVNDAQGATYKGTYQSSITHGTGQIEHLNFRWNDDNIYFYSDDLCEHFQGKVTSTQVILEDSIWNWEVIPPVVNFDDQYTGEFAIAETPLPAAFGMMIVGLLAVLFGGRRER